MTIISRAHRFIYLKSRKTAGTAVEAHLLTQSVLGRDIWSTADDILKYGLPSNRRHILLGSLGRRLQALPDVDMLTRLAPWRLTLHEHHEAPSLARLLGSFWDDALKVTNVRNPWDAMVSGWQWRRDGRGGNAEPITASFEEWLGAALSGDDAWRERVDAYDARTLMHPFVFIDGRVAVDILIRQESIDKGLQEVGTRIGVAIPPMGIREKQSRRKVDYRSYYTDPLAESVGRYFADLISVCEYRFDP